MGAPELTLITCTADQPTGFALCERFMQRQTLWGKVPLRWIVVDDGQVPARCTLGQEYIRRKREKGCTPTQSLCRNLREALNRVGRDRLLAVIEHDDFYGPNHLEEIRQGLSTGAWACGPAYRHYYNIPLRRWKRIRDGAPALCQMGFSGEAVPTFLRVVSALENVGWWGVDRTFWVQVEKDRRQVLPGAGSVVGIKGLPGRAGIGYGHRPPKTWPKDPTGEKLRELVGPEMAAEYFQAAPPPFELREYRDYGEYVACQVRGNRRKLGKVWAREEVVAKVARYILSKNSTPVFGLCHGTRRGVEQEWFEKYLPGCTVLGTELAPTAGQFPRTIQWDFHETKPEWLEAVDFVYSNSLDHSLDPKRALTAWVSCLKATGVCIIEHSPGHGPDHVSSVDPFGVSAEAFPYLVEYWGGGRYRVVETLRAPGAKLKGTVLFVIRRTDGV